MILCIVQLITLVELLTYMFLYQTCKTSTSPQHVSTAGQHCCQCKIQSYLPRRCQLLQQRPVRTWVHKACGGCYHVQESITCPTTYKLQVAPQQTLPPSNTVHWQNMEKHKHLQTM